MRILITGAAGFIGSHTVRACLEQGHEVIGVDDFNDYYNPQQKEMNVVAFLNEPNFQLLRSSILEDDLWNKIPQVDKIIHLAARAGVRASLKEPLLYDRVNREGSLKLLEAARLQNGKAPDLVMASSSSVYGDVSSPFREDASLGAALNPYAASKQAMEQLCRVYNSSYGLNITCLRFFTVFGPSGRPDMAPLLFTHKINSGEVISQFGDGRTERDYTYVSDIVEGILSAVSSPMGFECINLGNEAPVSLGRLIQTLEKLLSKKANIRILPLQTGEIQRTCADLEKARALLNYAPRVPFEEGLEHLVRWYLQNPL